MSMPGRRRARVRRVRECRMAVVPGWPEQYKLYETPDIALTYKDGPIQRYLVYCTGISL